VDIKSFIKDYLNFTRKERIATLVLVLLFLVIFLAPAFTKQKAGPIQVKNDSAWATAIRQLNQAGDDTTYDDHPPSIPTNNRGAGTNYKKSITGSPLFYFDPNTITSDQWKHLGVDGKTISTIKKYLSKGAVFRKPEDLRKIYGLGHDQYEKLAPYIKIDLPAEKDPANGYQKDKTISVHPFSTPHLKAIDINNADTTMFISLPGIGSKLAERIVSFRKKLGGFFSVDQIGEVYGLRDSVFQKIKGNLSCISVNLRKININTASKEELQAHPYIRWNIANMIIEYRNQHGAFVSLDDLRKISALDESTINKITHYLTL
jgi:competence ComEA-like helix-hairpin-helix protein